MRHVLTETTTIDVLPTEEVCITQGDQVVTFTREKALEALLFIVEGTRTLSVPIPKSPTLQMWEEVES